MWSSYKRSYSTAQIEKCDVTIRTLKSYRESATKLLSNNGIIYGYSYLYEYTYPPVDLYLISEKSIWKNLV